MIISTKKSSFFFAKRRTKIIDSHFVFFFHRFHTGTDTFFINKSTGIARDCTQEYKMEWKKNGLPNTKIAISSIKYFFHSFFPPKVFFSRCIRTSKKKYIIRDTRTQIHNKYTLHMCKQIRFASRFPIAKQFWLEFLLYDREKSV